MQETNRVGLRFYFEYDGPDHSARCRRTWGDGGIYDTTLTYPNPDLTVVTDSLGATTQYHHADGVATLIVDALGGMTQRVYNEYRELTLERDPLGQAFFTSTMPVGRSRKLASLVGRVSTCPIPGRTYLCRLRTQTAVVGSGTTMRPATCCIVTTRVVYWKRTAS